MLSELNSTAVAAGMPMTWIHLCTATAFLMYQVINLHEYVFGFTWLSEFKAGKAGCM